MGRFVEAEIAGRTVRGVLVLPTAALQGEGEILVVDDEDRLRRRAVRVLRTEGDRVVVAAGDLGTGGGTSGDRASGVRVALPGAASLANLTGLRVRPVDGPASAPARAGSVAFAADSR